MSRKGLSVLRNALIVGTAAGIVFIADSARTTANNAATPTASPGTNLTDAQCRMSPLTHVSSNVNGGEEFIDTGAPFQIPLCSSHFCLSVSKEGFVRVMGNGVGMADPLNSGQLLGAPGIFGSGLMAYGHLPSHRWTSQNRIVLFPEVLKASGYRERVRAMKADVGSGHACILCDNNRIYCWGLNHMGQADPSKISGNSITDWSIGDHPTDLLNMAGIASPDPSDPWIDVYAGYNTSCGVTRTKKQIFCWGAGVSSSGAPISPQLVTRIGGLINQSVQLALGARHWCALLNGAVRCWGENQRGQLSASTPATVSADQAITLPISNAIRLSAGRHHTCALNDSGRAICWGANHHLQLGSSTIPNLTCTSTGACTCSQNPLTGFVLPSDQNQCFHPSVEIKSGADFTCARSNTSFTCWGANESGQIKLPASSSPVLPYFVARPLKINCVGDAEFCTLSPIGQVLCQGHNAHGQMEQPDLVGDSRVRLISVLDPAFRTIPTRMIDELGVRYEFQTSDFLVKDLQITASHDTPYSAPSTSVDWSILNPANGLWEPFGQGGVISSDRITRPGNYDIQIKLKLVNEPNQPEILQRSIKAPVTAGNAQSVPVPPPVRIFSPFGLVQTTAFGPLVALSVGVAAPESYQTEFVMRVSDGPSIREITVGRTPIQLNLTRKHSLLVNLQEYGLTANSQIQFSAAFVKSLSEENELRGQNSPWSSGLSVDLRRALPNPQLRVSVAAHPDTGLQALRIRIETSPEVTQVLLGRRINSDLPLNPAHSEGPFENLNERLEILNEDTQ